MLRLSELKLPLEHSDADLKKAVMESLRIDEDQLISHTIFRRSFDARARNYVLVTYIVDVELKDEAPVFARFKKSPHLNIAPDMSYDHRHKAPEHLAKRPVVIGFGPSGIFAGLMLAQMGFNPIILERGKKVRDRTADTFGFWRKQNELDVESNVQFGEGGAGTFSDGKLYSHISDRDNRKRKVLTELVAAGANPEIIYVAKPHIGTFKLIKVVEAIREKIESLGGEIRFETRVDELVREDGMVKGVKTSDGNVIECGSVVMAPGHSARDTFEMLHEKGVFIEPKPFSIGFRIEHPQGLIDQCRWGAHAGNKLLGSADYKLVHHCKNGRSVYTFCMCPGGIVVAATSEKGCVVTNGMSQYSRDERNANSAIVVGITPEVDFPGGPLAGIELQRHIEEKAFELGGSNYHAPAQLLGDFMAGRPSAGLAGVEPSYEPGIKLTDLEPLLPSYAIEAIREAIPEFDKKIKGFAMESAVLTGVETRTSCPIRIKRGDNYQSINTEGLYPSGEGAGYAGGILSSAVDGIKVAETVAERIIHGS